MEDIEVKNAKIDSTTLGFEDHGIFTAFLHLNYGGSAQGFGGYSYQGLMSYKFLDGVLKTVGVDNWEDLPGKYIRVKCTRTKVVEIGNIIEDKWFNPEEGEDVI
jgi:hypothetical protein